MGTSQTILLTYGNNTPLPSDMGPNCVSCMTVAVIAEGYIYALCRTLKRDPFVPVALPRDVFSLLISLLHRRCNENNHKFLLKKKILKKVLMTEDGDSMYQKW